ncbi:protein-disulfide reductase DsbD family protein [Fulvimarina sp. 2208YS6-2-32]|uniref:Protein-disulfide reductase DsbD family protein n=1 Tax=Fulvimarina uroteuthidis TaxID=3098149 RepID=A0ABU5HZH7_9HYPH|nr:protein-disulfide reductase DsbD domain-containing protein [Fulvimarina sp. 2208YS6-2-32]MDY8108526.1 protein-disulfide reductase DsbD family protein [Fulvimarina sp. 2208YS6-2-32]
MTTSHATILRRAITAGLGTLAGICALGATAANAAGQTFQNEFATLSLSASEPGSDGSVRGALTIDLEPGWKTYWLDPGPSGIPPQIDFSATSGVADTKLFAPMPARFGEELARANGYKHDLALPFTIVAKDGETITGPIVAKIFLGVCEEICIPVQTTLTATQESDTGLVETAFATLPEPIDDSRVTARLEDGVLVLDVSGTGNAGDRTALTDAFVLGPAGWYFGEPKPPRYENGITTFRVPVDERPKTGGLPALTLLFADHEKGLSASVEPQP